MSIRLGINPLTWTIDDLPEVGGETSLETCLTEARAAGFEGVELGCKFPRTAPELKAALAPHGLALVSGWYSSALLERDAAAEFEAMRAHRELLSALGCEVVVVAETTRCIHGDRRQRLSQRPVLAPSDWPQFAARLEELGARLQDAGLTLAYHHHTGTVVQSEDEVDRLMDSCDDTVSLLLDTGHLTFAGGDPVRAASRHAISRPTDLGQDCRHPAATPTRCLDPDRSAPRRSRGARPPAAGSQGGQRSGRHPAVRHG
jgi:inosose dehydratase